MLGWGECILLMGQTYILRVSRQRGGMRMLACLEEESYSYHIAIMEF